MNYKKLMARLLVCFLFVMVLSCGGQTAKDTTAAPAAAKEESSARPEGKRPKLDLTKGKGSLSFKLDGQLYETDPLHTKCWTTVNIPLAMLMSKGDNGLRVSWQMGYKEGTKSYKLNGDKDGTVNFTVGGKTYWTKLSRDYLNITITEIKDKYSVRLLSGTFEGVLEDKDGNKVQITEGRFVTNDI
jgi:hypothetical protein